ncbi:MAG: Thoeris anti-defense Tad2 family protein [Planctomycetota bacterium]|jgi:hypothetical protein
MTFQEALEAMEDGKKVRRAAWNVARSWKSTHDHVRLKEHNGFPTFMGYSVYAADKPNPEQYLSPLCMDYDDIISEDWELVE